jgi:hypothetical protein
MAEDTKTPETPETPETPAAPKPDETTTSSTTPAPTTATPALPPDWVAFISPFAKAIGNPVEDVTAALVDLVGEPGQEAIELLQDAEYTPDNDITAAVGSGVAKAKLKKAIAGLRKKPEVPAATIAEAAAPMSTVSFDLLPQPPSDESWLNALKVGGVLKFDRTTVSGTVSAALAHRVGMDDLPEVLSAAMERHSESLEEPVGDDFYRVLAMLTQRNYSDIFAAMPGVTGRFATNARKKRLLDRMDTILWPALISFHKRMEAWVEASAKVTMNPSAVMANVAAMVHGRRAFATGMQPPSTDPLRDAAEDVVNQINKIFAGTGIVVAMALAYDAQQIRGVLENPTLPMQLGASNREQMLRMLNVSVSSDYPRLELSLKRFTLGIIELPNVTPGDTELNYLDALYQLGAMIPWDKLGVSGEDGGVSRRRSTAQAGIGRTGHDDSHTL